MAQNINPLKDYSDKKVKEFNVGIENDGVEYLIKMNKEVNSVIRQKGIKSKDYSKVRKEQRDEQDNK